MAAWAEGVVSGVAATVGLGDPASGEAERVGGAVGLRVGLGVVCWVGAGLGVEVGDGVGVSVTAGVRTGGWWVEDEPPMSEPTDVPVDEPPPTRDDTGCRVAASMAVMAPIASAKTNAVTPPIGFQRRRSTDSERARESLGSGRGSGSG